MIDDKKIEEAAFDLYKNSKLDFVSSGSVEGFKEGAKWAINELLKDLFHPASEVPRNDNGKVLAYSKERGYRKLYDMNDELDKTTCDTYQEMWEFEVKAYRWTNWIFIEEWFDMIMKGGEQ